MIREAIIHIAAGATLGEEEAGTVMEEIMTGTASPSQMGAFLTALRLRPGGETVEEITGLARVMREKAVQVSLDEAVADRALDTCGTGGDASGTFNVSTVQRLRNMAIVLQQAVAGVPMSWKRWGCVLTLEQSRLHAAFRRWALVLCLHLPFIRR
jgi:anthranilate phosphoribosyltransferase